MFALMFVAAALAPQPTTPAWKAWDACVGRTTTNYDWGQCGSRYIAAADASLNRAWKTLMSATSGRTKSDLVAEQRAWLAYRQAACGFYANGDWGREGQVLHYPACVAGIIERRTRELADFNGFVQPK